MKTQERIQGRPWLTRTGVELPKEELEKVARSWSGSTWEAYLCWYESGCREMLISPATYEIVSDEKTDGIFQLFGQEKCSESREECEQLLATCTVLQADVLRRLYIDGQTEVEIAAALNRSRTAISRVKTRALFGLSRGNLGEKVSPRQLMRGVNFLNHSPRFWDRALDLRLRETRAYEPENQAIEFGKILDLEIRAALAGLSEEDRKILYSRYWCGFSVFHTARIFGIGLNLVHDFGTAAIFRFIQKIAESVSAKTTNRGADEIGKRIASDV